MQLKRTAALAASALVAWMTSACNPSVPPASFPDTARPDADTDAGIDAATPASDTGLDAASDAATSDDTGLDADYFTGRDANFDAGDLRAFDSWVPPDTFVENDADLDAGPLPDTSACRLPDGGFDVCACGTFGSDCASASCATNEVCLADACGMHCVGLGAPCADASDCPATSSCDATSGRCLATSGCADSRDCATGFACEGGACVDRRIPCVADGCPFGFFCVTESGTDICARQSRPCGTDVGCGALACEDVNGDGARECNFSGTCTSNAMCAAGTVCAPRPVEQFASCGRYGPCRTAADCASGMACQDLWGDGVPECVDAGGACTRSADCAVGSVCATPLSGGPPSCLTSG